MEWIRDEHFIKSDALRDCGESLREVKGLTF